MQQAVDSGDISETWTELSIVGNDNDEFMLIASSANDVAPRRLIDLKNKFDENPYIKSIHLKIVNK